MALTSYWADDYVHKTCTVEKALGSIRSNQRVFIGSYCGEPQCLVRGLAEAAGRLSDVEIIRLMSRETTPLTVIAIQAKHVTDPMLMAASRTLVDQVSDEDFKRGSLYPPLSRIRGVSAKIAATVADVAYDQNLAVIPRPADMQIFIKAHMYEPNYSNYV